MIRLAKAASAVVLMGALACAQNAQPPAAASNATDNKAGAYYNFAMGRLYAELAASEGNKGDYVSKAVQHYQEALKLRSLGEHHLRGTHGSLHSDQPAARRSDAGRGDAEEESGQPECTPHAGAHLHAYARRQHGREDQRRVPQAGDRSVPEDHREGAEGRRELDDAGAAVSRFQQVSRGGEGVQQRPAGRSG